MSMIRTSITLKNNKYKIKGDFHHLELGPADPQRG